ncbi:hypothetical protein P6U16_01065 [Rhizobium sp. 32-5/1]|uniref:hypothetical protein n=1 Tax=Rhizobium sp. 32-5/1 TaxID=3019602 RepID=UPI00240DABC0|nr:hypothetical protein [Rhizobium sp. 32-5/1]WEZ83490.1 hypothetical protein P6U16_01065 [Rhizobium sp. 32-5/1]
MKSAGKAGCPCIAKPWTGSARAAAVPPKVKHKETKPNNNARKSASHFPTVFLIPRKLSRCETFPTVGTFNLPIGFGKKWKERLDIRANAL